MPAVPNRKKKRRKIEGRDGETGQDFPPLPYSMVIYPKVKLRGEVVNCHP